MPKSYSEKLSRRTMVLAIVPLAILLCGKAAMSACGATCGASDGRWFAVGLVVCAFAAFLVLGAGLWASLDDMQRQGQATSGYWGAMAGLGLAGSLIVATGLGQSEFALGVASLAIMQMVCSALVYLVWTVRGRGFSFRSGQ